jgi:predicted TIM-barrel fold metal-dependent hydrolase
VQAARIAAASGPDGRRPELGTEAIGTGPGRVWQNRSREGRPVARVIDSDQHLFEPRDVWRRYADPGARDDALAIVDDAAGNAWLSWRGRRIGLADVQVPGDTEAIGARRERVRRGEPPLVRYDEALPRDYWDPVARLARMESLGVDEAVLFPNYGLAWERTLDASLPALCSNLTAWNRFAVDVARQGRGRLHPAAHLTLRDLDWLERELAALAKGGVRLAMIAPALVDGRPLSHPALERAWSAFVEHGVTPVFHVADQRRPFDEAWYTDAGDEVAAVPVLESIFLWTAPALALTDLIVNGVLARHPALRIGVVELSAVWVPMYLMMLDGGHAFVTRLNGRSPVVLAERPSEYFRRQVRVSCFAYELPRRLISQCGELFMCCSDYPHSEGTARPLDDYAAPGRSGLVPGDSPAFFAENALQLLAR